MAIHIFTDKSLFESKDFIFDVEAFAGIIRLKDDKFTNKVLNELEKGSYQSEYSFVDRFGYGLRANSLSTGSKILLSAYYNPNYVINCTELGNNALDLLLLIPNCRIYTPRISLEFYGEMPYEVYLNNKKVEDIAELNYELSILEWSLCR